MPAAADRIEFTPPPQRGWGRALSLAVAAHLLLLGALTWGVRWKHDSAELSAQAELWAPTAQPAAPRAVEPPPAPPPPPPPPPQARPAPPPPPVVRDADIALERERKREAEEKARREQAERERQKQLAERQQREAEQKKQQLAAAQKAAADKAAQQKAAAEKLAADKQRQAAEDAKRMEALRQENLKRMQGLAGGTGSTEGATAARAAGPSDSYGGRIRARVKPNIVFTDDVGGNPTAEVEVRMAPDGTITSKRIVKPSGVKAWDDAVLRALERTEVLPRDIDGRVHSPLVIEFKLRG